MANRLLPYEVRKILSRFISGHVLHLKESKHALGKFTLGLEKDGCLGWVVSGKDILSRVKILYGQAHTP